jgi:hypothetical protein
MEYMGIAHIHKPSFSGITMHDPKVSNAEPYITYGSAFLKVLEESL